MSKPWFKLYRKETGSFAQLPLYVRALAAEILKLTDDRGVIVVGSKPPWEAIAYALGATKGDRRMLKRDVGILLADGYLVHQGDRLVAPNFPRFQGANEPREEREPTTNETRTDREPDTNGQRTVNERDTKEEPTTRNDAPAKGQIREEIEKKREEEIRVRDARASEVLDAFGRGWKAAHPRQVYRPPGLTDPRLYELVAQVASADELETALSAWWADDFGKRTAHGFTGFVRCYARLVANGPEQKGHRGPPPAPPPEAYVPTVEPDWLREGLEEARRAHG